MNKWWLISDEDVQEIRTALKAPEHDKNDYNCPYDDYSDYDGCEACDGRRLRSQVVHTLNTGLHLTDVVPSDFAGE